MLEILYNGTDFLPLRWSRRIGRLFAFRTTNRLMLGLNSEKKGIGLAWPAFRILWGDSYEQSQNRVVVEYSGARNMENRNHQQRDHQSLSLFS